MVNQDKLIIYLHSNLIEPSWWVVDAEYRVKVNLAHEYAGDLSTAALNKEIIVIIPPEDVLLTATTLPKMSATRLAQVLPYALEEQLISDVETLHFAYVQLSRGDNLIAAVIAHEKIQQWLTQLNTLGIEADKLLPLSWLLPYEENRWHILFSDIVTGRTGLHQWFSCDKNNLNEMLKLALSTASSLPQFIYIHNYTKDSIPSLNLPIPVEEIVNDPENMIIDLLQHAEKPLTLNLLQGRYAGKKSKFPRVQKLWRITTFLAAAWIALLFLYPTVSYFILSQKIDSMESDIESLYKKNFPQAPITTHPSARMQEKLQKLKEQEGENKVLLLLSSVGRGMSARKGIKINRFDFQNEQLTLEIHAATSDDIASFSSFLAQQGLNVKQQNASLVNSGINATLVVEK